MRTNSDLTIYNVYTDALTRSKKYQRSEIRGAVWTSGKSVYVAGVGLVKANTATILIPFAAGAAYLSPVAWDALTVKTGKWTLRDGDVVVRGMVADELTDAFTLSMLKAKYDDVLVVSAVEPFDQGSANMRHWRVGAK
jgi:hypothetical protein